MDPTPGAKVFTTEPAASIVAVASGLATRLVTGTWTKFVMKTGTTLVTTAVTRFVATGSRVATACTAPLISFVTNTRFVRSVTTGTLFVTTTVLVNTCTTGALV